MLSQDFEWGDDGSGAFEAIGEMISEAAGGEDATKEICAKLAGLLEVGAPKAAPAPAAAAQRRTPIVIGGLTAQEAGSSLGKLAKGVITACTDGAEKARGGANPPLRPHHPFTSRLRRNRLCAHSLTPVSGSRMRLRRAREKPRRRRRSGRPTKST